MCILYKRYLPIREAMHINILKALQYATQHFPNLFIYSQIFPPFLYFTGYRTKMDK